MESDSFSRFVLTLPAEANDSRPQGSFPGPAPGVVGGFGDNITITGTGISDVMREYIRVSGIVRTSGARRVSVASSRAATNTINSPCLPVAAQQTATDQQIRGTVRKSHIVQKSRPRPHRSTNGWRLRLVEA